MYRKKYVIIYLICSIVSTLLHSIVYNTFDIYNLILYIFGSTRSQILKKKQQVQSNVRGNLRQNIGILRMFVNQ